MASLAHLCLLLIFLFPLHISTRGEQICESVSCGEIDIQFPFGLKGANKGRRCSYPGFQLSCHNYSQTILKLPNTGDLVVKRINYEEQTIQVNDPDGCLPKRFLQNLSNSIFPPFKFDATVYELHNITFLRCLSNITESYPLSPISCLNDLSTHKGNSSNSSSVIIAWWPPTFSPPPPGCKVMSTAVVPILNMAMWSYRPDLITSGIGLTWNKPTCGECAARDQLCGFTRNTSHQVGCFSSRYESPGTDLRGTFHAGLPRGAKYGLIIGVGIPGLLCIIGLSCFFCSKFKMYTHSRRPSIGLPNHTSILALQSAHFMMGLDGPEIEKFPKTLIGESRRLPKSNDNTCPICLSEYEPKETLRTIPECNHYFHANCIDEWLKMNATCPLCRNSPDAASSTVTPSSSLSISSPLSSSP